MRVVVAFVLVTGCGRLNFDAGGDDDDVPPAITGLVASYTMEDDPSDGIEDRTGHGHHDGRRFESVQEHCLADSFRQRRNRRRDRSGDGNHNEWRHRGRLLS